MEVFFFLVKHYELDQDRKYGARKMAQQLKTLVALAQNPSLAPSTHRVAHNPLQFQFLGALMPFPALTGTYTRYMWITLHADPQILNKIEIYF